jgi:Protein of unknown function (DUF3443)
VRSFSIFLIMGSLVFLAACGSNGTPAGVPITLSVTANPSTLNPGQSSTITATVVNASNTAVTWSIASPAGFGTLSSTTANPVTYTAPATVAKTTPVTIMATSAASSSVTAAAQIVVQGATVSLSPAAPQTINLGGTLSVTATPTNTGTESVTWSLAHGSVGSLSSTSTNPVTYSAPTTGVGTAVITATSGSATQTLEITVLTSGAGPNVAGLTVGTGPVPYANGVLTSILVCSPGSTTDCQTVDSVLLDTGSVGLRVLGSQVTNVALTPVAYSDGSQFNECVQFLDGSFLWGGVSTADIYIGGEVASSVPVQVIANPSGFSIPTDCSNGGTNEDTQATLAANGILGVGPEPFDCGLACDPNGGNTSPPAPLYYASCTSASGCQSVFASCGSECNDSLADQQVTNPVILFTTTGDDQGTIISMTPPTGGAAPTASGTLTFGISSQTNNQWSSSLTTLPLNESDEFTTSGLGTAPALQASFIDSGSNGLFFPNETNLLICTDNPDFYCSTAGPLTVTNISQTTGATGTATFSVADADTLFANTGDEAFANLAGPEQASNPPTPCSGSPGSLSGDCTFDFGFPFFYTQPIFTAIDGQTGPATAPAPPWFAY